MRKIDKPHLDAALAAASREYLQLHTCRSCGAVTDHVRCRGCSEVWCPDCWMGSPDRLCGTCQASEPEDPPTLQTCSVCETLITPTTPSQACSVCERVYCVHCKPSKVTKVPDDVCQDCAGKIKKVSIRCVHTKDGLRCRRRSLRGERYCADHHPHHEVKRPGAPRRLADARRLSFWLERKQEEILAQAGAVTGEQRSPLLRRIIEEWWTTAKLDAPSTPPPKE